MMLLSFGHKHGCVLVSLDSIRANGLWGGGLHHVNFFSFHELRESLRAVGNADAQLFLGKMYLKGQGVEKDPAQANKWFKQAATQGNADAQFFLGAWYLLPHRDIAEGLQWLQLAAEQGNQDAQLLLGKAYLDGEAPRDPVQADKWLRLAAKGNLDFYQNELRAGEGRMTPDEIAGGKALADAWEPKNGLRPE